MTDNGRSGGKVKFYNSEKGFGFIVRDRGSDLFFHKTDVEGGKTLVEGQAVTFGIGEGKKGPKATEVRAA